LERFVIEHDIRGSGGAGCVRSAGQGTDIAIGADKLAIRAMLEKSSILIERDDLVRIGEMVSCENIRLTSFTYKPKKKTLPELVAIITVWWDCLIEPC
jgi:hypothetical protein